MQVSYKTIQGSVLMLHLSFLFNLYSIKKSIKSEAKTTASQQDAGSCIVCVCVFSESPALLMRFPDFTAC